MKPLSSRVERVETEIGELDQPMMIATRYPDGTIDWNGKTYRDETELDVDPDAIKSNVPIIILTRYRERKYYPREAPKRANPNI